MKLRQRQSTQLKGKLSHTLRSWLPILQVGLSELEKELKKIEETNPFVVVHSGFERSFSALSRSTRGARADGEHSQWIENICIAEKSLYEWLYEQIGPPLFPTPLSEAIAHAIVASLNEEGYFEGDSNAIARRFDIEVERVEAVRQRFAYLDPPGIGARDGREAMLFQLYQSEAREPIFSLAQKMIDQMDRMQHYKQEQGYQEALRLIRRFRLPPAIETMAPSPPIIADVVVLRRGHEIDVQINDAFYPDITIEGDLLSDEQFVKQKIREARDVIDALNMRKATLYKVALLIVELQYDFFIGKEIRPMKLTDIAQEFDHNPSTISRAIANKYLQCDRGVFAMKDFFAHGLGEEVSNAEIKAFIREAIAKENRQKPLSDEKLKRMIEQRFKIRLVRRTVTKYRKQMQIGSSTERKKLYKIC